MSEQSWLIGIAGGSGSGKTAIPQALMAQEMSPRNSLGRLQCPTSRP